MSFLTAIKRSRLARNGANVYVGLVVVYVSWTVVFAFWLQKSVLVRDQWHVYVDFFRYPFWQALWFDQNNHRLLFPNLFFFLDNYAFHGTTIFLQVCILLMNGATGYLLLPGHQRTQTVSTAFVRVCGGFVFVLLFWLANRTDLVWGLGVHYYLPALAAVVACRLVASIPPRPSEAKPSPPGHGKVAAAIVCGVVATFSFGSGMAIWPALVMLALWRKIRVLHLATLVGSGAIGTALYVFNLEKGSGLAPSLFLAPWKILFFVGGHVGSPIAQALRKEIPLTSDYAIVAPAVVGTLAAFAAAFLGLRGLWSKRPMKADHAFHLAVVFFVLAGSLTIAVGRLEQYGVSSSLSPRYMIWSLLFWAAVMGALPGICSELSARWRRLPTVAGSLVVVLTLLMLPTHYRRTIELGYASNRVTEAGLSLIVGVADEEMVQAWLYRRSAVVSEVAEVLKAKRWNLFHDSRLDLMQGPLPTGYRFSEPLVCQGEVTQSELLPGSDGDWRMIGWAWQKELETPPEFVLFTQSNQIVGMAQFTRRAPLRGEPREIYQSQFRYSVLRYFHELWPTILGWDLGWYGYAKGTADLCQLELYGLFPDGRTVCSLPRPCDSTDR